MAQATLDKRTFRNAPLETAVDRVWRFFCSVRAAVVEIAILAVLVLIGTLRGSSVPRAIADNIPGGRTICAFGEACSWPVQSFVGKFREDFVAKGAADEERNKQAAPAKEKNLAAAAH